MKCIRSKLKVIRDYKPVISLVGIRKLTGEQISSFFNTMANERPT